MNYETAMDSNTRISKADARREIRMHGADWAEFVAEYGDHSEYRSCDVLGWLGY